MDPRLKSALTRFGKVLAFAAAGQAATAVASLNLSDPAVTSKVVIYTALSSCIAAVLSAAQKYLAWDTAGDPDPNTKANSANTDTTRI